MRHLTTEELLRHFDGELIPERAEHIDRCGFCQEAMVGLQSLLYEVELALKRSVPAEPAALREASLERLRGSMRPLAPVVGFPQWRRPAYGIAATILMAALGGYMALNSPPVAVEQAGDQGQASQTRLSADLAPVPAGQPTEPAAASDENLAAMIPASVLSVAAETAPSTPERFAFSFATTTSPDPVAALDDEAPALEIAWSGAASRLAPFMNPAGPISQPLASGVFEPFESARGVPATVETASTVVDGHWLLAKAGVWREDLRPAPRNGRLTFVGTVEDETSRRRVVDALSRTAGEVDIAFDVRSRRADHPVTTQSSLLSAAAARPSDRPSGGVVRTSLLSHFSDAARRSFQTPEPSLLEAELDRYVSGIFRGQSRLLSHAYALNDVLSSIERDHVERLAPETKRRLREVIRLHLSALRDEEAALYDRLSEVLPRRYWAYRADKAAVRAEAVWLKQGKALLDDALQLDSTLTSLFGALPGTVHADQVNHSCGELLSRLRGHIAHLKAPLETLQ